jgi:uncharacterized membrane protein YsdA (DUF1294 family)
MKTSVAAYLMVFAFISVKARFAHWMSQVVLPAYLIVVAVMSLACFITYGMDQRQAAKGGRRVSERTLHLMAFLGGWPGALIAQRQFHHKTQKVQFRIVFWMVVVIHIGIVGAVAYAVVS